jgi:nitrate reductase gamma subunit
VLSEIMNYCNHFFFSFYPYICFVVFVGGCILRFDRDQFSWQANSSQIMSNSRFRIASNLFHLSLLGLAGGHAMGLLVPHWVNEVAGITGGMHQKMELVMGGSMGVAAFVGLSMLLYRRFSDVRVSRTGNPSDLVIAVLLWVTIVAGMSTLPWSFETRDSGIYMYHLNSWSMHVLTFRAGAAESLHSVPLVFKIHMVLAMTVFMVLPFTRLVHLLSAPFGYLFRSHYQIVRSVRS